MDAVILSGGQGTRLYPLTLKRPKSTMDFLDRPLVDYQLDLVEQAGCKTVALALGHMSEAVENTCRSYNGRARMEFVSEDKPLGTGGALANALQQAELNGPVMVVNGDIICDLAPRSLLETHERAGAFITLVGAPVRNPEAFGLLSIDEQGLVTAFTEKTARQPASGPSHVNAGIYLLSAAATAAVKSESGSFSLESDFFPEMAARGRIAAHLHQGFWRDVGTLESYFNAHFDVLAYFLMMGTANFGGKRPNYSLFRDLIYLHDSVSLGDKCDLFHRVVLMAEAKLAANCHLRNCILLPGTELGEGCTVETALIDRGTVLPAGAEVQNEVRSGDRKEPFTG